MIDIHFYDFDISIDGITKNILIIDRFMIVIISTYNKLSIKWSITTSIS